MSTIDIENLNFDLSNGDIKFDITNHKDEEEITKKYEEKPEVDQIKITSDNDVFSIIDIDKYFDDYPANREYVEKLFHIQDIDDVKQIIDYVKNNKLNIEKNTVDILYNHFMIRKLFQNCLDTDNTTMIKLMKKCHFHKEIIKDILHNFDMKHTRDFFGKFLENNKFIEEFYDNYKKEHHDKIINFHNRYNKHVISYYKLLPWSKGKNYSTFIAAVNECSDCLWDFDDFIKSKTSFRENKDKLLFDVNDFFYELLATNSILKKQDDGIFTFTNEENNKIIEFEIYYGNSDIIEKNTGDVYINESMFFDNEEDKLNVYSIDIILNSPNNDIIFNIGTNLFKKYLITITKDTNINNKYPLPDNLRRSKTIRLFVEKIANVIVFLKINDEIGENIFQKRLQKYYYKPDALFDLSREEKLPTLLYNNEEYRNTVNQILDRKINTFVYLFGKTLFKLCYKLDTRDDSRFLQEIDDIDIDDSIMKYVSIHEICDNHPHKNNEENFFINESSFLVKPTKQCYTIKEIFTMIANTSATFSPEFIEHFNRTYDEKYVDKLSISLEKYSLLNSILNNIHEVMKVETKILQNVLGSIEKTTIENEKKKMKESEIIVVEEEPHSEKFYDENGNPENLLFDGKIR